jgi:hypothetical protein
MSDDSFVREVDEAVRQDELKRYWDRYGVYVLAGALLIVATVAGYKGWGYWRAQQAASAGARFVGAQTLEEDGKTEDAVAAFKALASDGPAGYQTLSQFELAAAAAEAGRREEAVKTYDALAADAGVDEILQGFARLQAAALLVDTVSLSEMKTRIDELAEGAGPWRNSAREYLGLTAYREGDNAEAERYFRRILLDPGVPANMRSRAQMMLALIVKADEPSTAN